MSGPNIPKRIMMFRDFVPDTIRVGLCLLFALIFQFSGGIYLSSVSQMVGSLALKQEDIMMAGYASFVGMTLIFPILFRLKFRFTTRSILICICPLLILCNLITIHTASLPLLVITCFVAGALRMWGTFECLSNVQLSITPTRNFGVFFPVVYLIVLGSIQLSGLVTVYLGYWMNWHYMHLFIVALLLVMWLCAVLLLRDFRFMRPLPLFGIDWIGGILWAIFLLSVIFVLEYGKFYDWFDSSYIWTGVFFLVISLLLSLYRMFTWRHPYLPKEAFLYRNLGSLLLLFLLLCIFLSTPTVLQNIYTGSILKYDVLNNISLNWWNLGGTVLGCVLTYAWHVHWHGGFRTPIFVGFALIVAYQFFMYFVIDPRMNIEWLYLPAMLRGAGYIILYISLTVYVSSIVPFQHFFHVLSIMGFVRTGFGSVMGGAIMERMLQYSLTKNTQLLSITLDPVNRAFSEIPFSGIYGELMQQSLLVSLKEIYGWTCWGGVVVLLVILAYRFITVRNIGRLPGMRHLKQIMKRELPMLWKSVVNR